MKTRIERIEDAIQQDLQRARRANRMLIRFSKRRELFHARTMRQERDIAIRTARQRKQFLTSQGA